VHTRGTFSDQLAVRILWGMAAGAALGLLLRLAGTVRPGAAAAAEWLAREALDPLGLVFLRLLFFVVVPLVFASLALGILQLGRLQALGPLAGRTFALFGLNMAVGVALGLVVMNTLRPGQTLSPESRAALLTRYAPDAAQVRERASQQPALSARALVEMFLPANLLRAVVDFQLLPLIVFALLVGVAAALWGSDIVAKEERDKTVDFILTLPITRQRLITAKAVAAVINCAALVLIIWAGSLVAARPYHPDEAFYRFLALQMQSLFLLMLLFLAIGMFLGCALRRYKRVTAIAVALLLSTFFMSTLSDMDDRLDFLKYVSPFKYFDAGVLYREGQIEGIYWVLTLLIIAASMAAAYVIYSRRDIYA
jgi:Na+/H+-dicarboxylate symporter